MHLPTWQATDHCLFVLLWHELPVEWSETIVDRRGQAIPRVSHLDLMIEHGQVLITWEIVGATADLVNGFWARRLDDHRREYLDYEGPISGGRGSVSRRDRGEVVWNLDVDQGEAKLQFSGDLLAGPWVAHRQRQGSAEWWSFSRSPGNSA